MAGHLWNVVCTAWEMLRNALSTSNLSLAVFSLCIPLAVFVVTVIVKWNEARSRNGLVLALKASVKPVLIGAGVTILAWSCLFLWALYKSVYNDHQNLAGRLRAVVNEKDTLKRALQNRDSYIRQLTAPQITPENPKTEPLRITTSVAFLLIPGGPPEHRKQLAVVIVNTNKNISPVDVILECDAPFVFQRTTLADQSGTMAVSVNSLTDRRLEIGMTPFAWTPSNPLIIAIGVDEPVPSSYKCSIKQRRN